MKYSAIALVPQADESQIPAGATSRNGRNDGGFWHAQSRLTRRPCPQVVPFTLIHAKGAPEARIPQLARKLGVFGGLLSLIYTKESMG